MDDGISGHGDTAEFFGGFSVAVGDKQLVRSSTGMEKSCAGSDSRGCLRRCMFAARVLFPGKYIVANGLLGTDGLARFWLFCQRFVKRNCVRSAQYGIGRNYHGTWRQ